MLFQMFTKGTDRLLISFGKMLYSTLPIVIAGYWLFFPFHWTDIIIYTLGSALIGLLIFSLYNTVYQLYIIRQLFLAPQIEKITFKVVVALAIYLLFSFPLSTSYRRILL